MATSQDFVNWICGDELEPRFLQYLLLAEGESLLRFSSGAVHQTIYFPEVKAFHVCVPTPAEQRRIIAVLDDAIEGIATAKSNAEKNLLSARKLFDGYLQSVFAGPGDGWSVTCVGAVADCCLGKMLDKAKNKGDPKPYLRNLNVRWFEFDLTDVQEMRFTPDEYERYSVRRGDVVICEGGYPGRAAIWGDDEPIFIQKALHRVRFTDAIHGRWFLYYLYSQEVSGALRQYFTGTGIQHFTGAALSRLSMPFAPIEVTAGLVDRFDIMAAEVSRLEAVYRSKLAALDEFRESLLHQALSGQLKSAKPTPLAVPQVLSTTSPEFSANVIGLAYERHKRQQRERTFGHVKEQKLLHLVEAIAKVDLGRQPMKDAAGPNDFPHMLKAEEWAKRNGLFEMVQRDEGGYDFKKLPAFDQMLSKAPQVLGASLDRIESVIDLLIPMDTVDAEVLATVHAAWNNLLIDGAEVTDAALIWEARDGWHANKLAIPESKFRQAIALIRSKGLVPDGTGKYVGGQSTLL